jgi:hypothetical protein
MELDQLLKETYDKGFRDGQQSNTARHRLSDCEEANLIMGIVCEYYRVTAEQLTSASRKTDVVTPRAIVMYLMRRYSPLSLKRIGEILDRDHTTVIHAVDKVTDRMSYDEEFEKEVKHLEGISEDLVVNLKPVTIAPKPQLMNKCIRPIKGRPKKKIVQVDFSMIEEVKAPVNESLVTFFHRPPAMYSNTSPYGIASGHLTRKLEGI